jgi:hypothetical protein
MEPGDIIAKDKTVLLVLHVAECGEIALLDWRTVGVVYSNAPSLVNYQKVSFPRFVAYDFYESPEWKDYEPRGGEALRDGTWEWFSKLPEAHRMTRLWSEYKEREKRASLLLRYFKAQRNLEGSRTFWETQAESERTPEQLAADLLLGRGPGETATLAWIGQALRDAYITPEDFAIGDILTDNVEEL